MTLGAKNLSVICYELSNENIGIENAISGLFYDITEQDFLLTIK
jgi:hypothetical protein